MDLQVFEAFGMIVLPSRVIAIGSISMIQPHPTGAITLTFVGGADVFLETAEAKEFVEKATAIYVDAQRKMMQTQSALIVPR